MQRNINITKTGPFYARYKNDASKYKHFLHYHDAYELCFFVNVSKVNLEIFIKDSKYEIKDGDLIFINELDVHRYIFRNENTAYNRYLINFKKEFILSYLKVARVEEILNDLGSNMYTHAATNIKEKRELELLFNSLITVNGENIDENSGKLQQASVKSYLLLILIRTWEIITSYKRENQLSKKAKLVQDIIQFIDTNYASNINLDLLADQFFVDKFYMSRIFKKLTDLSIMEYVQQRRIIEAQKILKDDIYRKVIDVCLDCGFNNTQHFHRVFKEITGTTPHKYRHSHKET